MSRPPSAVSFEGVTKVYRQGEVEVRALRGLDLEIAPGELTAVVGPSGSGKSTALHLAGALDLPTAGTVRIDGVDLATLTARERAALRRDRIGFVFQSYNLVPVMTAFENAASVLSLQGVPEAGQRTRVSALLDELGIGDLAHRRPSELSGGQQQRVAIARAVAARPAVVLADEPTANVDSATADLLMELIRGLNARHGVTFLLSTHDARVLPHVRRVVTLVDGVVAEDERRGAS